MYQLIITEINNDADLQYFGKWIRDSYPDFTGFSVGSQVYINFSTEPSEADKTTITDTYATLTVDDIFLPVEQSKLTIHLYENQLRELQKNLHKLDEN